MLQAGVYQVEHAAQVDVDSVGGRLRRQSRGERADTGVGDHHVEVTEFGNTPVDGRGKCRAIPDVGDRGDDALAFLLDQTGGFVEVFRSGKRILVGLDVFAQVDRDDVGTLGGEHSRVRTSLAAGGATDDRHFARYSAHSRCLLMRSTMWLSLG